MAIVPVPHLLHPPLRSHAIRLKVRLKQSRSPPRITTLWKKRREIPAGAAANVLSCNFRFPSFTFLHMVLSIIPQVKKALKDFLLNLFRLSAACCFFTINISSCPSLRGCIISWLSSRPSFQVPSMSSITEASQFTSTAPSFGCKYFQSALYLRFSTQLAAGCPRIRRSFLIPRSFLAYHSFHSQRATLLHHHDTTPLSLIAIFFRDFQCCIFIYPLILIMTMPSFRHPIGSSLLRCFLDCASRAIGIYPRPTNGISVAMIL